MTHIEQMKPNWIVAKAYRNKGLSIREVPTREIRRTEKPGGWSSDILVSLKDAFASGAPVPYIVTFRPPGKRSYRIIDGHHRYNVFRRIYPDAKTIPVLVQNG